MNYFFAAIFPSLFVLIFTPAPLSVSSSHRHIRITGGYQAQRRQFPYMLSLQYYYRHICGAALMRFQTGQRQAAVTSATCVTEPGTTTPLPLETLNVTGGGVLPGPQNGLTTSIAKMIIHPDYRIDAGTGMPTNDLALLFFGKELKYSDSIEYVLLDFRKQKPDGPVTVTGWDTVQNHVLMGLDMEVEDTESCKRKYLQLLGNDVINGDSMWCGVTGKGDACNGSIGGPATQDRLLVGVVSWAKGGLKI